MLLLNVSERLKKSQQACSASSFVKVLVFLIPPSLAVNFLSIAPLHTLRLATTDSPSVLPENHMIPQNPTLFPSQAVKNDLFLLFTEKM